MVGGGGGGGVSFGEFEGAVLAQLSNSNTGARRVHIS